jgi:hypothetical protein
MADQKKILKSLQILRNDALARRPQLDDAAIAYGWSMIRIGQEILGREMDAGDLYRLTKGPHC